MSNGLLRNLCYLFVLLILFFQVKIPLQAATIYDKETGEFLGDDLQDAINVTAPGATLVLEGNFFGSFIINKSLKLKGDKEKEDM